MIKIFVAGNPLVEKDSLALKVAKELKQGFAEIEFEEIDSLSGIEIPKNLYILDVAEGIEKVLTITDLSKLQSSGIVSLHDFDLGTELLLYKKLGKLGKVTIIAIPLHYSLQKAIEETRDIIKSIGKEN